MGADANEATSGGNGAGRRRGLGLSRVDLSRFRPSEPRFMGDSPAVGRLFCWPPAVPREAGKLAMYPQRANGPERNEPWV